MKFGDLAKKAMEVLSYTIAACFYVLFLIIFLFSLSIYSEKGGMASLFFYVALVFAYLDSVKRDGWRFRAGFRRTVLHMSTFTKYLGCLAAISTIGNLVYFVRILFFR